MNQTAIPNVRQDAASLNPRRFGLIQYRVHLIVIILHFPVGGTSLACSPAFATLIQADSSHSSVWMILHRPWQDAFQEPRRCVLHKTVAGWARERFKALERLRLGSLWQGGWLGEAAREQIPKDDRDDDSKRVQASLRFWDP